MEYSFKLSADDGTRTILLSSNALHLYLDGVKYTTPYEKIVGVWLSTPAGFLAGNSYACTLNVDDAKPIYIAAKNLNAQGDLINQDNHYNSFIRVLHVHLKEKSKANYYFGVKPVSYVIKILVLLGVVTGCLASYFAFNLSGIIVFPIGILLCLSMFALLRFGIKSFPKLYDPNEIPLELLPN